MLRRLVLVAVPVFLATACGPLTPASLEFVGADPEQPSIGQSTTLSFLARDGNGQPMAGVEVRFSFAGGGNPADVELQPRTALTNRGSGIATVEVKASRVQSVIVVAEAGANPDAGETTGETRRAQSPPITFAGSGTPSGRQLTFQCGDTAGTASGGAHAIMAYDDTRHLIAGVKINCTAHIADRNGDGVPNVVVSFLTEAGTIGPSATSGAEVIGNATTLFKTSEPLPKDVEPVEFSITPLSDALHMPTLAAPLWMHPFEWKENPVLDYNPTTTPNLQEPRRFDPVRGNAYLLNPRDNLVTMIAVTQGEEGYTDINNNGQYDTGEPFDDLTEPFVDSDDNGTKDDDERWVDTDGDGLWDGKNNLHDSNTNIWVSERILWTGIPHARDYADVVSPVFSQVGPDPVIFFGRQASVVLLQSDPWFNSLAQNGGGDGCSGTTGRFLKIVEERFGNWVGVALSYPSPAVIRFTLEDARELQDDGGIPPPTPPFGVTTTFTCSYSQSPLEGYTLGLALPVLAIMEGF